jgi:hypothetical protein
VCHTAMLSVVSMSPDTTWIDTTWIGNATQHRTAASWAHSHAGDEIAAILYDAKVVAVQGRPASAMAEEGVPEGERSKASWDAATPVLLHPNMLPSPQSLSKIDQVATVLLIICNCVVACRSIWGSWTIPPSQLSFSAS